MLSQTRIHTHTLRERERDVSKLLYAKETRCIFITSNCLIKSNINQCDLALLRTLFEQVALSP